MPSLREELELPRVVAAAIEKHARGDVEKLALGIINDLRQAGFDIVPRRDGLITNRLSERGRHLGSLAVLARSRHTNSD